MNKKKKNPQHVCNNTYLQNVQIYKMLERIRFYPNRNIFDFRDEIFEKKKEKEKERFCIFNIGFMRCTFNSYSYRRTCTPKSFCEWIKHVNFLHKGYYDIMYYD